MLKVDDISYTYEGQTYRYSLSIQKGEIVAIMGGSGSGKSTLLDLMAGFLKIESGSILLDGVDISKKPIEKRDIAILFQHNNLFEHLNIQDNITIGNKKKIDLGSILKELGLEGYEKKYPHQLSGGEQQRVALARTLLRGDKILLLDEPFSALDSKTRLRMLSLIAKITKEKNLYTIFITHNKEDSDLIANKLYIMRDFCLEEN